MKTERIRELNDLFRATFLGGRVVLTQGVAALPTPVQQVLIGRVRAFDTFNEDNDPHGEHDFGSIEIEGETFFWKIDCYDKTLAYGSPDPADPELTARVLTMMLASEY
jgi:hypothetical protein